MEEAEEIETMDRFNRDADCDINREEDDEDDEEEDGLELEFIARV